MNTTFDTLFGENRVRSAILGHLRGTRPARGTIRFNCPMCVARGETPDRRRRGGIAPDAVAISCFNCGFAAGFTPGEHLSRAMKDFLAAIGVQSPEIARLQYWAAHLHSFAADNPLLLQTVGSQNAGLFGAPPRFQAKPLPDGARPLFAWADAGCDDPDFLAALGYLTGRGATIAGATTYYWTPNRRFNLNQRVIIPCFDSGTIAGWIARSVIPSVLPKYHNATPHDLLFNADALANPRRRVAILVEGVFDALAIDAVGLLGNRPSEAQIAGINASGKDIVVLPDRDRDGGRLIAIARQHNWAVAAPRPLAFGALRGRGWWDDDIKDAADAVQRYGQLYSLHAILASATATTLAIEQQQRGFLLTK